MFKELFQIIGLPGSAVTFTLTKTSDNLLSCCIVMKSKDAKQEPNPPIVVTGTPEELDDNIVELLSKPIERTTAAFVNIENYEKALKNIEEAQKKQLEAKTAKRTGATTAAAMAKTESVFSTVATSDSNTDADDDGDSGNSDSPLTTHDSHPQTTQASLF